MSSSPEKNIIKTLKDIGLTQTEAEVYLFLPKNGACKGTQVAKQIGKDKAQIYHILKSLQAKGLVESTLESPVRYSPVPFENVVESAIKEKHEEAARIEGTKKELLEYWKNLNKEKSILQLEKFVVIEGRHKIYSKVSQMVAQTENQMSVMASVSGLLRTEQYGVYDLPKKDTSNIHFRFITDISNQNIHLVKKALNKMSRRAYDFRGRNPELGQNLFPRMVIKDDQETLFFITPPQNFAVAEEADELCLWTNCKDIVKTFKGIFDELWQNSTDIETKMDEIEKGKVPLKTCIISDANLANKKYNEALSLTKKQIHAILSEQGLIAFSNNKDLLHNYTDLGVEIRIMAPITSHNQQYALQLMEDFEIRHIPLGNIETVILDNGSLFEFKAVNSPDDKTTNFDRTFFTTDPEYIEKTQKIFNYLWETAQIPSAVSLETISQAVISMSQEFQKGALSRAMEKMDGVAFEHNDLSSKLIEKDIIKKMIIPESDNENEKGNDLLRMYGTLGQAIIHLPKQYNLPDLLFHVYHLGKQSTYGAEDVLLAYSWQQTPMGNFFVLSAVLTDNPKTVDSWKRICANSPAEHNIVCVNPSELEVRLHGDTLFVGWTKQIVINPQIVIPPSCLIIEKHGELKTDSYSVFLPSGYKLMTEGTHSEAFVTFLYPSNKYQGPGIDGAFGKDVIMEFYGPPKPQ